MDNQVIEFKIGNTTNIQDIVTTMIQYFFKYKISIKLIALNKAITKAVLIAEVIRSRLKNIHQIINIGCINNDEMYSNVDHLVPKIEIFLMNFEPDATFKQEGYSAPYPMNLLYKLNTIKKSEIKEKVLKQIKRKQKDAISVHKKRLLFGRLILRKKYIKK